MHILLLPAVGAGTPSPADRIDLAFTPQINEFRGRRSVQLVVGGIRPHRPEELCGLLIGGDAPPCGAPPDTAPTGGLYPRLAQGKVHWGRWAHGEADIEERCPEGMEPERFCLCLRVPGWSWGC
jgi:hypothetical protein